MEILDSMTQSQLANIERSLGEIQGTVKAIESQMQRDRQDAKESRQKTYDRVERIEETVEIAGKVAAQARDKADTVEKLVVNEVKPQTDKIKNLGVKGGGFLAGAALIGGLLSGPAWASMAKAVTEMFR